MPVMPSTTAALCSASGTAARREGVEQPERRDRKTNATMSNGDRQNSRLISRQLASLPVPPAALCPRMDRVDIGVVPLLPIVVWTAIALARACWKIATSAPAENLVLLQ